jgi:hypothetical protein
VSALGEGHGLRRHPKVTSGCCRRETPSSGGDSPSLKFFVRAARPKRAGGSCRDAVFVTGWRPGTRQRMLRRPIHMRRVSLLSAVAAALSTGACEAESVGAPTREAATTIVRADAGASGAGAADADAAMVDVGSVDAPPPREGELPSFWEERVASVCRTDADLCAENGCPTFADGLEEARTNNGSATRDYCVSEDGQPYITLAFSGFVWGATNVYAVESGELVSRIFASDVAEYCEDAPTNTMVTGLFIEDCMWVRDALVACTDEAAPDLSSFDNCWYDLTP